MATTSCATISISPQCPLPPRQRDVLRGLAESKVYKQIALDAGITVSTVRSHIVILYKRLGVIDRGQAVIAAYKRGWLLGEAQPLWRLAAINGEKVAEPVLDDEGQ
jgi:DNA-binding NarL/FixJ family response regulator